MAVDFIQHNPYERTTRDTWLIFKLMAEFVEGFEIMKEVDPAVSIFGSARFKKSSPHWKMAERVSQEITRAGFSLISGGGPGLMEAANRGARKGIDDFKKLFPKKEPPLSVGLSIQLPHESKANPYIDVEVLFKYFFVRKVMFAKYASAFVILPGGFGTMDELFEALTLIQTKKIRNLPIVMMGKDYWAGMLNWIKTRLLEENAISRAELALIRLTDDPVEAVEIIKEYQQPRL